MSGKGCGLRLWHSRDFFLTLSYATDRSKAVVPVLVYYLLLCGVFYEASCCMSYHVSFCSYVFQSF